MMTDHELAVRVATSGDASAFAELVNRHQGPIRSFLRRLLAGDDAAADDLAQETFLLAFQKLHTFKGTAKLSTWLHTIAYRQFIGLKRKTNRLQVMAEVPDQGSDTRQAVDNEILARQLMEQLGERDRACLTLSYAAGLSHADIANIIGQPIGSVKSRIHRAKARLQQWLETHDYSFQSTPKSPGSREERHAG